MVGEVLNEPAVEVGELEKGLDFFLISWSWPFHNSCNLSRVHFYGVVRDDHSEIFHFGLEFAFVQFQEEFLSLQEAEDMAGESPMLFYCLCEYEDVIQIYHHDSFHNEIS